MVFQALSVFTRVIFCTSTGTLDRNSLNSNQRLLHDVALMFDIVDLVDAILDTIEGVRLMLGKFPVQGMLLLIGMGLARYIASRGKVVLLNGGLYWAPFFQDPKDFLATRTIEQQQTLRTIYAILFTEMAIFLFEDAALLSIWAYSGTFDGSSIFDRINGWVTFLSTAMGAIILFAVVVLSLFCCWSWKRSCSQIFGQIILAFIFLFVFGVVFLFLLVSLFLGFQILSENEMDQDGGALSAVFTIFVSWTLALFFTCRLTSQSNNQIPIVTPNNNNIDNNHNDNNQDDVNNNNNNNNNQNCIDYDPSTGNPSHCPANNNNDIILQDAERLYGDESSLALSYPFAVAVPLGTAN